MTGELAARSKVVERGKYGKRAWQEVRLDERQARGGFPGDDEKRRQDEAGESTTRHRETPPDAPCRRRDRRHDQPPVAQRRGEPAYRRQGLRALRHQRAACFCIARPMYCGSISAAATASISVASATTPLSLRTPPAATIA